MTVHPDGYVIRGTVRPSQEAQDKYPLAEYPCERCAHPKQGLPHLVDNSSEFYWEHQHADAGYSARSGCGRFNDRSSFQGRPRPGTATPTFYHKGAKPGDYDRCDECGAPRCSSAHPTEHNFVAMDESE